MQDARQILAMETAQEALRAFNLQEFDMVITNVSLPAMSGLELARRILDLRPHAPIIIASGYFLDLPYEKLGSRVRSVLKPFDETQIDALIAELCVASEH
jgi:two-component system, cell cycle response regulator CpdR